MEISNSYEPDQLEMRDAARLCCHSLASTLGDHKVAYPDSPAYAASLASYYSAQQEAIRPACIIFPQTTGDVSNAVKILVKVYGHGPCKFAIRSGGHSNWAEASNIAGGVTLDLRRLNSADVSEDATMIRVGPGATWDTVYQKLDPLRRSVAGGRVAGVGVGGLTLGGGISHLSPQYGWTCDTVRNFQVVLSDGKVVDANANENADLFFALRGGGNNFGIVTRIDLETYSQGLLWSAFLVCKTSLLDENIKEFVRLSSAKDYDEHASFILSFAYIGAMGDSLIANMLVYTEAVENPPIYRGLMELPTLQSSTGLKNMTTVSLESQAMVSQGARSLYRTLTIISTEAVLQAIHTVRNKSVSEVKDITGISWVLSFDPIPCAFYASRAETNALGLTGRDGAALLVVLLDIKWTNSTDDDLIASVTKNLLDNIESKARALGAYDPFVYLNYAGPDQDPIASYGVNNRRRLVAVQSEVDPAGVFTKIVPGGHKLAAP